jgi:recombination protein RecT
MKPNPFEIVKNSGAEFNQLSSSHKAVTFAQECEFALQALQNNSFLYSVAERNPQSLKDAILNIASAGITLNPVFKHAYLVPRDGKICLDVSFQGLVKLACDGGSIVYVQAYVVHKNDSFDYQVGDKPKHNFNPFGNRGERVGAYCVCKLKSGEFLVEIMDLDQIHQVRSASQSYKAFESGKASQSPWVQYEDEMFKKTVVKRAYKMWPKHDARLEVAVHADNESEFNFEEEKEVIELESPAVTAAKREELYSEIKNLLGGLTKGATTQQKGLFLLENFNAKSFDHFKRLQIADLEATIEKLKTLSPLEPIKTAADVKFTLE